MRHRWHDIQVEFVVLSLTLHERQEVSRIFRTRLYSVIRRQGRENSALDTKTITRVFHGSNERSRRRLYTCGTIFSTEEMKPWSVAYHSFQSPAHVELHQAERKLYPSTVGDRMHGHGEPQIFEHRCNVTQWIVVTSLRKPAWYPYCQRSHCQFVLLGSMMWPPSAPREAHRTYRSAGVRVKIWMQPEI